MRVSLAWHVGLSPPQFDGSLLLGASSLWLGHNFSPTGIRTSPSGPTRTFWRFRFLTRQRMSFLRVCSLLRLSSSTRLLVAWNLWIGTLSSHSVRPTSARTSGMPSVRYRPPTRLSPNSSVAFSTRLFPRPLPLPLPRLLIHAFLLQVPRSRILQQPLPAGSSTIAMGLTVL